jgi:hypothetical protein
MFILANKPAGLNDEFLSINNKMMEEARSGWRCMEDSLQLEMGIPAPGRELHNRKMLLEDLSNVIRDLFCE